MQALALSMVMFGQGIPFIHGGDDPFNLVQGTKRFFEEIAYPDKTLKVYAGSRHETHNDLEHEQVAEDIIEWILNHC